MVMSWVIHIGMTISVIQSVGAYMISSMYMFMVMSLGFIEQVCGVQPSFGDHVVGDGVRAVHVSSRRRKCPA